MAPEDRSRDDQPADKEEYENYKKSMWATDAALQIERASRASDTLRCPAVEIMSKIIVETFLTHLSGERKCIT